VASSPKQGQHCARCAALNCRTDGRRCASPCRELGGKGIAGALPPGLAAMDQLQLLDLGGNAFSGGLPAAWGAPDAFPLLVSLDLKGNALTGEAAKRTHVLFPQMMDGDPVECDLNIPCAVPAHVLICCRLYPHLLLPACMKALWPDGDPQPGVALPAAVRAAVGRYRALDRVEPWSCT
jgi:hypothetical protein